MLAFGVRLIGEEEWYRGRSIQVYSFVSSVYQEVTEAAEEFFYSHFMEVSYAGDKETDRFPNCH